MSTAPSEPGIQTKLTAVASHPATAMVVLAIGVVFSAVLWQWMTGRVEYEARERFEREVNDARDAIETRIHAYSDVLLGVRGLFIAADSVSRDAFRRYVSSLDLYKRYPGIKLVTFNRRVPLAQKREFEAAVRRDTSVDPRGYPDFAIKPAGDRPEYYVVDYLEPMAGNEGSFGLDAARDAVRLASVERARDSGQILASGRVILEQADSGQVGFLMRLAVYRNGMPLGTVEQRRQAFIGLMTSAHRMDHLMPGILREQFMQKIRVRIHDAGNLESAQGLEPPTTENLIFDSLSLPAAPGSQSISIDHSFDYLTSASSVDVGGRRWNLTFSAQQDYATPLIHFRPFGALFAGIIISSLLFVLLRSMATGNQRAMALATRITSDLRASEAGLVEAQRMTQELIEALPNPIFFKDTDGRYLGVNKAWEAYFGTPRAAFLGKSVHDLYPKNPEVADRLHAMDQALWDRPGSQTYETSITTPDGHRHDAVYYKATFTSTDGSVAGLIGTIIDITERKQAELRRAMEHTVTRLLSETEKMEEVIPQIIQTICETLGWACGIHWRWDENAQVLRCAETWHIDAAEVAEFVASTTASFNEALAWQGDAPRAKTGGLLRRVWTEGAPVWFPDVTQEPGFRRGPIAAKAGLHCAFGFPVSAGTQPSGVMEFYGRNIVQPDEALLQMVQALGSQIGQFAVRRQVEERVRHLAHFDELTGLPNRNMFNQQLTRALAQARRHTRQLAVLFIDLDRFKNINDTLGHDAGDRVLKDFAERLRGCLRDSDTIGRFGGDEFVVLVEELPQTAHVAVVAQKILVAAAAPFLLDAQEFHISASIGISTYPDDGADMQGLLKNADIAMYRAKEQGKNNYQFYSAQMNSHSLGRAALESSMRHALERNEFLLHYQPKVDLGSGRVTGMEALVRWQQPGKALVPPAQFIALAEETGLIVPLGEWVLRTACVRNKSWQEQGLPPLRVAVNLSARQFVDEKLLQNLARILQETGLDPASLEFEITESMVMHNPQQAVQLLGKFKAMGIHLSIDDFGTGYSSLSYLKRFPIDSVKIDRSFIQNIPGDLDDAAITQAIIAMAHSLRLKVIAEGVETEQQLDFLRDHECDEIQGYYFSKPVPEDEFLHLLQTRVVVADPGARAAGQNASAALKKSG